MKNIKKRATQISSADILLNNIDFDKPAGIDNISGKFLRDDASILAVPISQLRNIPIKYSTFLAECKIVKLKLLFKNDLKLNQKTIVQYLCFI